MFLVAKSWNCSFKYCWKMSSWSLATAVSPTVTGDVIQLSNLKASSETTIASPKTTAATTTTTTTDRPTTPIPNKKLNLKRPPHLTLRIQPPTTSSRANEAPLAEAENLATPSIYGTPLGSAGTFAAECSATVNSSDDSAGASTSTAGSIFPHEQYKTIKRLDIQFDNVRYSSRFGFFKRGESRKNEWGHMLFSELWISITNVNFTIGPLSI